MKSFAIFLSILPLTLCTAQNLVPNSGFENYKVLPCALNQFRIQELLEDWIQPLPTTTDYWNLQSPPNCYLVPNAEIGLPRTGDGMAGIITAVTGYSIGELNESREYLEVKLLEPLKKGTIYEFEFYVMSPSKQQFPEDLMTSNNLGVALSTNEIIDFSSDSPTNLRLPTQLNVREIIADRGTWKRINGCIYADSAYQYLIIGNFFSNANTLTNRLSFNNQVAYAYYFIDDITLTETPYSLIAIQRENPFCYDQSSILLNASAVGATGYLWEDGDTNPEKIVTEKASRDYSVTITFNLCQITHSFNVEFVRDVFLGADTLICKGEQLTLYQNYEGNKLIWWDGTADSLKTVSETGMYWAQVNYQCNPRDSIQVTVIDCPGVVPNVITPNSDEFNQYFKIENISNRKWSLNVINRWGLSVYQDYPYRGDWDGKDLPEGAYFYILHSEELNKTVKGWVQIIRSDKSTSQH